MKNLIEVNEVISKIIEIENKLENENEVNEFKVLLLIKFYESLLNYNEIYIGRKYNEIKIRIFELKCIVIYN